MKPASHPTALRIQQLLRQANLGGDVVEFERPTRTSAEAAAAIGCSVAEIAKSVVFRIAGSDEALVVVTSGDNRVSQPKAEGLIGAALGRADAEFVRQSTGHAIGGVSPLGFERPVRMLLDEDLQRFDRVWAAAGTPFSVFPLTPAELAALTGAGWANVRLDA